MRLLLACAVVLGVQLSLSADEKTADGIDAKKLVGKWTPKKEAGKSWAKFTDDGKVTVVVTINEKEMKYEGTYKVSGNKLMVSVKVGDKEMEKTVVINELTETEMVTTDEQGKKEFSVRKKD